jgi:Histidine kinase
MSSVPERVRQVISWLSVPIQIGSWLIYISLPLLIVSMAEVLRFRDALHVFSIKFLNDLIIIGFFYFNLYRLTPNILRLGRVAQFVGVFAGLCLLLTAADWLYYRLYLREALNQITNRLPVELVLQNRSPFGIPMPMLLISVLTLLMLTILSSGLALYRDRAQYVAAGQQMVIQKQKAELTALKLQISPHFLFNTLNNLRWLARQKSDETEEAIMRLSDLMRYMIYHTDSGPVTLAREIEYLRHYIELQKLRLADNNSLTFSVEADDTQALIEPLLFIHFVENAFKHGLHGDETAPIAIKLTVRAGTVFFETRNRLFNGPEATADSGLGIQNIERRLALHYPHRHQLRIYGQNGLFCVDLTIQLGMLRPGQHTPPP